MRYNLKLSFVELASNAHHVIIVLSYSEIDLAWVDTVDWVSEKEIYL